MVAYPSGVVYNNTEKIRFIEPQTYWTFLYPTSLFDTSRIFFKQNHYMNYCKQYILLYNNLVFPIIDVPNICSIL